MNRVIGITGGMGSGKTFISKIINKLGYPVFNSDLEAKRIIASSQEVRSEIIELIGKDAFLQDNSYNTDFVSKIVFNNSDKLERLNQIIHSRVRENFSNFVSNSNSILVFGEAAIIYETSSFKNYDRIILVTAPIETRVSRCMDRDDLSRKQVLAKMSKQWTDEQKLKFNPFVIVNDGKSALMVQIEDIIERLLHEKRELKTREDIAFLVNSFYGRVFKDEILFAFFSELDFDKHLPKMVDFWCYVLLGESGYTTNVIEKHLHLSLKSEHFERWIYLFNQVLDDYFEGDNVELAKQRAFTIAWTTKSKMGLN